MNIIKKAWIKDCWYKSRKLNEKFRELKKDIHIGLEFAYIMCRVYGLCDMETMVILAGGLIG